MQKYSSGASRGSRACSAQRFFKGSFTGHVCLALTSGPSWDKGALSVQGVHVLHSITLMGHHQEQDRYNLGVGEGE